MADRWAKVFAMPFASVYPLYLDKVVKKGRTKEELDTIISWLTGYDAAGIGAAVESGVSLEGFFEGASLVAEAELITGMICGMRVEEIEDPLIQRIRMLDKIVDELAKGRPLEKIMRSR